MTDTSKTDALLTQLIKLGEQQARLQRFALLGPERIIRFVHLGEAVDMYVPFGDYDYIQRNIIGSRGFFEKGLLEKLRLSKHVKPGGVIVDAGANIGNHTVFFGRFLDAAKIHAFEPQPAIFDILNRNVELNLSDQKVVTHNTMLGEAKGHGEMVSSKPGNTGAGTFDVSDTGTVPMVTLDAALGKDAAKVSLLKIDVEGFQDQVLRGANRVLTQAKPPVWIEVFADEKPATDAIMADLGYAPQQLHKNDWLYLQD